MFINVFSKIQQEFLFSVGLLFFVRSSFYTTVCHVNQIENKLASLLSLKVALHVHLINFDHKFYTFTKIPKSCHISYYSATWLSFFLSSGTKKTI